MTSLQVSNAFLAVSSSSSSSAAAAVMTRRIKESTTIASPKAKREK